MMTQQEATQVQKIAEKILHLLEEHQAATSTAACLRPLILVPGSFAPIQTGRWPVYGSDAAGMECLRLVGGSPFGLASTPLMQRDHLALLTDDAAFDEAFEVIWSSIVQIEIRGWYLAGGGDLCSVLYGQSPGPTTEDPDLCRDLWERYLLLIGWLLRWPTLGVCRGMQHMNMVLGGGLIQDLPAQWRQLWAPYAQEFARPPLLHHRALGRSATPDTFSPHPIQIDPASRLATLVQLGSAATAKSRLAIDATLSLHRQAVGFVLPNNQVVGYVAAGQRVGAIAPDGVIEELEAPGKRFWIAVQFHPEWSPELAWARGIFRGFVQAAKAYRPLSRAQLEELKPTIRLWVRTNDQAISGRSAIQGQTVPSLAGRTHSGDALLLPANGAAPLTRSRDLAHGEKSPPSCSAAQEDVHARRIRDR